MLRTFFQLVIVLGICMNLAACSNTVSWDEEVKLNDGRMIVVTQKRRGEMAYDGNANTSYVPREAWLTLKLPELGEKEVTWTARLEPRVLNVHEGKLYIVGVPFTMREFDFYGRPQPHYLGFKYETGQWQQIAFREIPESIYDTNMLLYIPPEGMKFVSLAQKASEAMNGNWGIPKEGKRIDPMHKSY